LEFSKEKNPTQSKLFSKRYFLVLFFLLFLVVAFFPTHNADALDITWKSNSDYNKEMYDTNKHNDDSCINPLNVQCWVLPLFKLTRTLLEVSLTLFIWIIDTDNIKTVLGSDALFTIWAFVRDLLNMAFIMVLLFSAFCTIFQIEQYNYKKMLWKIVLMALLVNFSFPITRFIIDASNILMYSLINGHLFGTDVQTGFVNIAKDSALDKLLTFTKAQYPDTASLLAATVMLFMLAITYIAIGALLLVRLIALAIIIILSPIAFTGSIIPGVSAQASKWWDNLFKYSFFGPIMILGVIISIKLMATVGPALGEAAKSAASPTDAPTFIGTIVLVSVPIVLLWTVMGIAQSMSIAGATTVMGGAQKVMAGAGKKFSGYNAIKKQYGDYKKERDARKEEARFKFGKGLGERVNDAQDTIAATVGPTKTIRDKAQKRMDKRRIDKNKKDIDEGSKDLVDKGETADNLASELNNTGGVTFDVTPPDKKGRVEQAQKAQAYLRQDADERRIHIQTTIQSAPAGSAGGAGSDLEHIINKPTPVGLSPTAATAYTNAQNAARDAATRINAAPSGMADEHDLRTVSAFISRQMRAKVETGAKAT